MGSEWDPTAVNDSPEMELNGVRRSSWLFDVRSCDLAGCPIDLTSFLCLTTTGSGSRLSESLVGGRKRRGMKQREGEGEKEKRGRQRRGEREREKEGGTERRRGGREKRTDNYKIVWFSGEYTESKRERKNPHL